MKPVLLLTPSANAVALDAHLSLKAFEIDMSEPENWLPAVWFLKGYRPDLAGILLDLDAPTYERVMRKVADLRKDPARRQRSELLAQCWAFLKVWMWVLVPLAIYGAGSALGQLLHLAIFGEPMPMEVR